MDAGSHRLHDEAPILASIGLRDVLDGAPDLIFACDRHGHLLWLNAAVEEFTGRARDELIGQSAAVVIPAYDWRRITRFLAEERRRGALVSVLEAPVEVPGGSRTPVAVRLRRFEAGGPAFYVGVARESAAEGSNAELEVRLEQVTAALEEARTVAQLKADTLATMTHEIRSPMNGILGLLQILLEGELDGEQRSVVEILQNSSRTLLALVNDTLEFSRLEAGKVQLNLVDFDVVNAIHDVSSLLGPIANEKGLGFECRIAPEVPRHLHGDPGRIRQVLMNLATNAIKFTESGSVAVRVKHLQDHDGRHDLWFAVTDSGIGIAPDAVARLFQPYEQASAAIAHRFGGTGLGLSICRKLVNMMGGEMGVESTVGQGSTFWFRLALAEAGAAAPDAAAPLSGSGHGVVVLAGLANEIEALRSSTRPAPSLTAPTAAEPAAETAGAPAARSRILVVEDSQVNQLVAVWTLQKLGHEVDTATSGDEALARCAEKTYDVVLLDLNLAAGSGLDVARALRQQEQGSGRHAHIAAMTGAAEENARARCLEAGMDDFLAKPIDLDVLSARVKEWTTSRPQAATPAEPDPVATPAPAPPVVVEASPTPPAVSAAPAPPPGEITHHDPTPAIDLARLDIMSMGSPELRATLLQAFMGECEPRLARLESALAGGEVRTVEFEAHGLKGMTGTIGAVAAETIFGSIEHHARDGELAAIQPLAIEARSEVARVAEFIRTLPPVRAA